MPGWGTPKQGPLAPPGHSPDVLLGIVGASNQAGNQVCKAGTPQGEGPPPAPQHPPTSAPGHAVPEGQRGMSPRCLHPLAPCWQLCLILGSQLAGGPGCCGGGGVSQLAGWPGGLPVVPQTGRTWVFRELRAMGARPGIGKELPAPPTMPPPWAKTQLGGMSLHPWGMLPPTWVLRGGVGQEEASSRAVAGAVEQDGHGAGVCHQERGGGDGVPAEGPCGRDGAVERMGLPRDRHRHPDPRVSPPLAQPSPGPGGLRHLRCA